MEKAVLWYPEYYLNVFIAGNVSLPLVTRGTLVSRCLPNSINVLKNRQK